MADLFLGLDLGTSGCKLIAFDGAGNEVAHASRSYALANPGSGLFELDADLVWSEVEACFAEVDAGALPGRVRTLSVSAQGEAILPVDRSGRALAPSPVSADMRGAGDADRLVERFGTDRLYAITGQPASPLPSLPKLMWWRRSCPDLVERTWKFLCYGEFALLRLGLRPVIDEGMAARTMAYDIGLRAWSGELLDFAGIAADKLADVAPSGTVLGTIAPDIAARLSLPEGVSVVLGGHDQPMGALGAGIIAPGAALYALGTTEAFVAVPEGPSPALGRHNIPCYPHVVPGRFVALAGSQSGGRVLAWYRQAMAAPGEGATEPIPFDRLLAPLADVPPSWPILLPHFAGSGSVLNDHASLGALFGLQFDTSREDILLAVLEGITFEQALSLEALSAAAGPTAELRAIGGGTRSPFWLQMKADILGRPITRLSVADAPCLGAAILGRRAIEPHAQVEAVATAMVKTAETVHPRAERHAAYAARLEIYRSLYAALRPVAPRLRALWQETAGPGRH